MQASDLDFIAFYEKTLVKFERLLETYLAFAPSRFRSFVMAIPVWLKDKLYIHRTIRKSLPNATKAKLVFTEHHESHLRELGQRTARPGEAAVRQVRPVGRV